MRRLLAIVVVVVAACGSGAGTPTAQPAPAATPEPTPTPTPTASPGGSLPLLTGDPLDGGCYLAEGGGTLVFDPSYGTAIIGEGGTVDGLTIVAWRPGYTARPNGSEFDVLDPQGRVVATTGQRYLLHGGYADPGEFGRPDLPRMVWWTCEDPEPLS
jgi:hypothetical protein